MDNPTAQAAMLIRRPVAEVFAAFTDPAITSKFWFSEGSTALREAGQLATWKWGWFGTELQARVVHIEPPHRLEVEWPTTRGLCVTWDFKGMGVDATFVEIEQRGFSADEDGLHEALMATEGFALVLAGAKAWLEHGILLGLVPDRFPYATFRH